MPDPFTQEELMEAAARVDEKLQGKPEQIEAALEAYRFGHEGEKIAAIGDLMVESVESKINMGQFSLRELRVFGAMAFVTGFCTAQELRNGSEG